MHKKPVNSEEAYRHRNATVGEIEYGEVDSPEPEHIRDLLEGKPVDHITDRARRQ
jgi:hypothetical protein